jgi:hypothetical protein
MFRMEGANGRKRNLVTSRLANPNQRTNEPARISFARFVECGVVWASVDSTDLLLLLLLLLLLR